MKIKSISMICMLAIIAFAGCGGDGDGGGGPLALDIVAVTPTANSTDAAVTTTITAQFNQDIDSSTLTTSTFTLTGLGGTAVAGAVSYDSSTKTATFTPTLSLKNIVTYTATITTGVVTASIAASNEVEDIDEMKAQSGLQSDYTWQFTTVSRNILYQSSRALDGTDAANANNTLNIWAMNADGSGEAALTSLTADNADSTNPQWSPDGTKIVYQSQRALYGADAANTNATFNIWVMNADGGGSAALTTLTTANSYGPRWSPDGRKIVFYSTRALNGTDAANANITSNIWVMNADGSSATALTSLTANDADCEYPQWSPDGTRIAYDSPRAVDGTDAANANGAYNVWVMSADGSDTTPLTSLTGANVTSGVPQWSPDGTKLVYVSTRALNGIDTPNTNNTVNVWVMMADGSGSTAFTSLTAANANSWFPQQWSPDGTKIVFPSSRALDGTDAANTNSTYNIWVINASGSGATPLTSLTALGAVSVNPQWSSDGTRIAFDSRRALDGTDAANSNYTPNIWVMNADGSGATALTSLTANNAGSTSPQW